MKQQCVIESEPNSADSAATSEYYPTNENYDSDGQYWHHQHPYPIYPDQYRYRYRYQDQLRMLGPYEEYDPNIPAVMLKSESENPAPLEYGAWNSEPGTDCNSQVEYQFKQEIADYSPVSTPESVSTISESTDYTYNLDGYVFGNQDTSDVIDPNTLFSHSLHQYILKAFERGCYLVQNEFGQFELSSEPDYAQFAAGSDETRAQDEQLMLYNNIGQLQEGFFVPEYQAY